jgi:hypothetical protein
VVETSAPTQAEADETAAPSSAPTEEEGGGEEATGTVDLVVEVSLVMEVEEDFEIPKNNDLKKFKRNLRKSIAKANEDAGVTEDMVEIIRVTKRVPPLGGGRRLGETKLEVDFTITLEEVPAAEEEERYGQMAEAIVESVESGQMMEEIQAADEDGDFIADGVTIDQGELVIAQGEENSDLTSDAFKRIENLTMKEIAFIAGAIMLLGVGGCILSCICGRSERGGRANKALSLHGLEGRASENVNFGNVYDGGKRENSLL